MYISPDGRQGLCEPCHRELYPHARAWQQRRRKKYEERRGVRTKFVSAGRGLVIVGATAPPQLGFWPRHLRVPRWRRSALRIVIRRPVAS